MSDVHAGPRRPTTPGRCYWRHHHEDVDLACTDRAIPGELLCADHYIEAIHRRANAEAAERLNIHRGAA